MTIEVTEALRRQGIQPSAQRVAIAEYVLATDSHPSADQVWARVRERLPQVSRATVYNTLNLFVREGLLRELVLAEGRVVFDPNVEAHHHFIDAESGAIHDVPWEAIQIRGVEGLRGYDVEEYQVVMRGRARGSRSEERGH
jgi:Fur family iron response transcriptional regulator